jgi:hypothetical protein
MSADKELPVVAQLVTWKVDGQEWVQAHASDLPAADQARKHGVESVPLCSHVLASARIAELEQQLEQAKRVLAQVRREIVHRPTCAIDMLPQLDAAIASQGTAQEVGSAAAQIGAAATGGGE